MILLSGFLKIWNSKVILLIFGQRDTCGIHILLHPVQWKAAMLDVEDKSDETGKRFYMSKLSLDISPKALEYMRKKGKEFRIIEKTVSAGWRGNVKTILVEDGTAPSNEYIEISQEDIKVWIPGYMDFKNDLIAIDLGGFPWARTLILKSWSLINFQKRETFRKVSLFWGKRPFWPS